MNFSKIKNFQKSKIKDSKKIKTFKKVTFKKCCYQLEDLFIISTLIPGKPSPMLLVGYIPEKNKIKEYLPAYNQILNSFAFVRSDSE